MSTINRSPIDEFEALQGLMNEFSANFDNVLTQKRSTIINDKQLHYVKVNELKNQETQLESDIESLKLKEVKVKDVIKKTMEDLQLQQIKVDELIRKQDHLINEKTELQIEIDDLATQVQTINASLERSQSSLAEQLKKDHPELIKYEQYLGLKIDVTGQDSLKFIFGNIDPNDLEKEVWCELHVGDELFKVGDSFPLLSPDVVKILQDEFNDHKELVKFLKSVRILLVDLI